MMRIGIVDADSSHSTEFTKRINHVDIGEEQWVEGARVVAAFPGYSEAVHDWRSKNETYTQALIDYGVEMVDSPEALLPKIDAALVSSDDGRRHYAAAKMLIEAGVPTFVDKPMTCSLTEAVELAERAEERGVPLYSGSSLRYAPDLIEVASGEAIGEIVGADAISPAKVAVEGVTGLMYYGIHGVETLYTLMGPGCEFVQAIESPYGILVAGEWSNGRLGGMRGFVEGSAGFGYRAVGESGTVQQMISAEFIYRELLKRIIAMFETGEPPLDIRETLEIIAFIEAALQSAESGERVAPAKV
ncbi:MAG: Gfo/Idh/MocA family protein [Armatimonadota bacterium]